MSVILRYKEWLTISPEESYWVYDLCSEMPEWSASKKEYVFRKAPKRIDAQKAREIIRKEGLVCVCNNEYGRIYK
jgi:hypothetical protein